MGFAPANFQLAMPFRFYLASNTGHRQTDRQTDNDHHCIMPPFATYVEEGVTTALSNMQMMQLHSATLLETVATT